MPLSNKEELAYGDMRIVQEMYARGFEFEPIDIFRAKSREFQIIGDKLMPSLNSIDGLGEKAADAIVEAAKKIPVFFSANYSLGIAVLADLAQKAAAMFPDADIEIVETHHNQKLDVPSGTALLLANGIKAVRPEAEFVIGRHENGKRTKQQIGIHSLRLGSETGTHEILISTGSETLTLTHRAENRALFAEGALRAASWLMGKPAGLYAMRDLIGG